MIQLEIAAEKGITEAQVADAVERARRGFAVTHKRLEVIENGYARTFTVERRGVGPVQTPFGKFELYSFEIQDSWKKYTALVMADAFEDLSPRFLPNRPLIVRLDSGCETGQLFGDQTCDCREQLELGLQQIAENGQGILINIPHQDGRGLGISFKLATLRLQNELGVDTVQASKLLQPNGSRDDRTYGGAIAILKFLGVDQRVTLSSNNPSKMKIFDENRISSDNLPIVIPPTAYTRHHLAAKAKHLGHDALSAGQDAIEIELPFLDKLKVTSGKNQSLVCCGLDPDTSLIPPFLFKNRSDTVAVLHFLRAAVQQTKDLVCAYKIQKAFFDLLPDGSRALKSIVSYIRSVDPSLPIIVDAKTGDIENTMDAYLRYFFVVLGVDAILVNPYMGDDVFTPFERYPSKGAVVLARTSNPGGALIQDRVLNDSKTVWRTVFETVEARWKSGMAFIPVVAATTEMPLLEIAATSPDMPIFLAGVGAQGGAIERIAQLLQTNPNRLVLVNSSRALLYEGSPGENWAVLIGQRTREMRDRINACRPNDLRAPQ